MVSLKPSMHSSFSATATHSTSVIKRTVIASAAAATVLLVGVTGLVGSPEQAFAATSSASATVSQGRALPNVVVGTGSSATIPLGNLPAGTTSVTVSFQALGAWQNTNVSAAVGPSVTKNFVITAKKDDRTIKTVTLPVKQAYDGLLTIWSSSASVDMRITLVSSTGETPATVPSGTPNADNTGVPSGVTLTKQTGDIHVTTAGTVINGLDLQGRIYIDAPNVTVKNSIIRGSAAGWTGPSALIVATGGYPNAVITDTELVPTVKSGYANGILGSNFTATRLEIHDIIDGIHIVGDNVTLQSSWLHDNVHLENDPNQNGTPSHDDSIQVQKGTNILIDNNSISGAFNSGMQITQDAGIVSNLRFTNNSANNGACTVNVAEKGKGAFVGLVITDNKFGRNTTLSDCAVIAPRSTTIRMERNFYVPDHAAVTVRNGG